MIDYTGQRLGNYQVRHLVGRGGFADVYLGEHIYLKTPAAIKILQMQLDREIFENFLSEARTIAHLSHPNITPVLEFGIEGTMPYLVMGYAPFGSLRNRHPHGSTLPFSMVLQYVKQVAAALQYAHDKGIIHRDVKPENMLLGHNEAVMLTDFGIATKTQTTLQHATAKQTDSMVGTASYMAPEQLQGRPVFATDQYALAVVSYEWLCGSPPFEGMNLMEIAVQQLQAAPPPLQERVPDLSPAVEQTIMRALAKDPTHRFPSVLHFAQELSYTNEQGQMPRATKNLFLPASSPLHSPMPPTPGLSHEEYASATVAAPPVSRLPQFQNAVPPINTPVPEGFPTSAPFGTLPPKALNQFERIRLSRRQVVIGLAAVGVLGIGGIALARTRNQPEAVVKPKPQPTPTPKPSPTVPPTPTVDPAQLAAAAINGTNTRPTATGWGGTNLDLMVRGADNALWYRTYDGIWRPWNSLGAAINYDPALTSSVPGRIDLFTRMDAGLQYRWFDGTWHDWIKMDVLLTAAPTVTSSNPNQIDLFIRGGDGSVWYRNSINGTWQGWQGLGGTLTSAPSSCSWGNGRLDVFGRGTDNALWHKWFDGGAWHDWESLGGIIVDDPSVCTLGVNHLDVFVRVGDNTMQHRVFNGSWQGWESLGGSLISSPAAAGWSGQIGVFSRGFNNSVQLKRWAGVWLDWQIL